MTQPRFAQVSVSDTPWYRSVSRCVRRALYAVMSNHFHVVVRIDAARADSWSTILEESDFTAVQQRLGREPACGEEGPGTGEAEGYGDGVEALPRAPLMPFDATGGTEWAIPYALDDYLELVDWLGRAVHPAKKGRIPPERPKILARLGLDAEGLAQAAGRLLQVFGSAVGATASLTEARAQRQLAYLRGIRVAERVFPRAA